MTDFREALAALILGRTATSAADAILAAGWTPPGERVKPSEEDVAREWGLTEQDVASVLEAGVQGAAWRLLDLTCDLADRAPSSETVEDAMRDARDVLALLPGRAEAVGKLAGAAVERDTAPAESGEQPGAQPLAPCTVCAVACTPDGWGIGVTRPTCVDGRPHRFAPVVPDSADVRERVRTEVEYRLRTTAAYYRMRGKRGEQPEEGWIEREIDAATDAVLATVGQGVTAEQARAEAFQQYPNVECNSPYEYTVAGKWRDGFVAGATWASAAVRPSGQEGP